MTRVGVLPFARSFSLDTSAGVHRLPDLLEPDFGMSISLLPKSNCRAGGEENGIAEEGCAILVGKRSEGTLKCLSCGGPQTKLLLASDIRHPNPSFAKPTKPHLDPRAERGRRESERHIQEITSVHSPQDYLGRCHLGCHSAAEPTI